MSQEALTPAAATPLKNGTEYEPASIEQSTLGDDLGDKPKSHGPDGGLRAWLALSSSFCMLFCTFGLINCTNLSVGPQSQSPCPNKLDKDEKKETT